MRSEDLPQGAGCCWRSSLSPSQAPCPLWAGPGLGSQLYTVPWREGFLEEVASQLSTSKLSGGKGRRREHSEQRVPQIQRNRKSPICLRTSSSQAHFLRAASWTCAVLGTPFEFPLAKAKLSAHLGGLLVPDGFCAGLSARCL